MQQFDKSRYPHLCMLDEKVQKLLLTKRAKSWGTARTEYEICKIHPIYWMEQYGFIRPGEIELDGNGTMGGAEPIPFKLNPVQLQISDRICKHFVGEKYTRVQAVILKHRKAGISTLAAAYDYWFMRFHDNINAFAIADLGSHTDNIVEMIKLFHDRDECGKGCNESRHRPPVAMPMPKNKKGMRLKNGSMLEQDTGENSNPGTSGTINVCHMSENAKWRDPDNAETSLLNSIPRAGFAFVIKESTAFGINKYAQDCEDAEKGKSAWEFIFITWLDMPDCEDDVYPEETIELTTEERELMAAYPKMRMGHIKFRRRQIETLGNAQKFKQDFPLNPREPFLITGSNFFNTSLVQDRMDTISFYRDWKERGMEAITAKYPEMVMKLKHHPRGIHAALQTVEMNCVIPQRVEITNNDGNISYINNKDADLDEGAGLMFRIPRKGRKYLVSVDVAEGKQNDDYTSDNSIIEVFDTFSCEQVMEWGGVYDEEMTAVYAVMIAKLYNNAPIAPEMNNTCGGMLWKELERTGYKNLFYREVVSGNKRRREPGWDTKAGVKKDVFGQYRLDFKNGICLLHSMALLEEMMYFLDKQGKLGAADNHKDDRVSATGINLKIISVTPSLKEKGTSDAGLIAEVSSYVQGSSVLGSRTKASIGRYM